MSRLQLAVDLGTSNTVAMLTAGGPATPLLLDGSPMLPSAVCLDSNSGVLLVGRDAERASAAAPERIELHPKRRIDEGSVWLAEREVPVAELLAAVLRRVVEEAERAAGKRVEAAVLTHPAGWGAARLAILAEAAGRAGLDACRYVPEPVAAAWYFANTLGKQVPHGNCVVVYDLGAGTFDVAVVRRCEEGFAVVASDGLPDAGGLDLDAIVVGHLRSSLGQSGPEWARLDWPQSAADRQARYHLWQDARAAKEHLSRHADAALHVPLCEVDMHITRDEFQALARPLLERTVALTLDTIRAARIGPESIAGVFLVGGSSRIPFVSTLLHRRLGVAPTIIEQPELVVATGAAATELPTTDSEAAIGAAAELPSTGRPAPVTRQAAPTTEAGPTVRLEPTATTAPEPAGAASWTWESRIPTGLVVAVHALAVPLIARLVGHLFTDRPPTGLDLLLGMALLVPGIAILVSKRKATRGAVATVTIMFDAALLAGGVALSLARTVAPVQELWRNEIPPSNGWSTLVFVLSVALFLSGVLLMARGRRVRLAGPSKDVS